MGENSLDGAKFGQASATADLGRFRPLSGAWYVVLLVFTTVGVFLAVNQIFTLKFFVNFVILDNSYLYLLLGLFLSLVFLVFPATAKSPRDRIPLYDIACFLIVVGITAYFALTGLRGVEEAWEFMAPPHVVWLALVMWVLILEAVRRAGGIAIFFIFGVLSLYPLYADAFFVPEIFSGMAQDWRGAAGYHLMSRESVLGIPMTVVGTLIVGFIIFGITLQSTGGGRFFINLAFSLLGSVRGGPAKVAIVASGMFGSLSGSVITNVLTTGAMTIPAMKRTGYPARYAAGIEACASTGGVLMPPVMGATAFVMASFLDISYLTVALAAVIPSILYFFGLFVQIDAYAARKNIKGLPKDELPTLRRTVKEGWFYIFAFLLLIYLLVYLKREAQAPFFATVALLALSPLGKLSGKDIWYYILTFSVLVYIGIVLGSLYYPPGYSTYVPIGASLAVLLISQLPKRVRLPASVVFGYFSSIGHLLAELVAILAAVGLIIGGLMVTGMAGTFSGDLVRLAGGNLMLLLMLGALTSFILGIGMTVTAAYIFLAIVLAPGLVELGLDKVAVHLFILYWGMISFITPPVALGAYAAASLAGAPPIRTGLEAMRLGSIIYFLPFFFVLNPALIFHGPPLEVLFEFCTALAGITLLASGLQGYLIYVGPLEARPAALLCRALLVAAGLLLAFPEMITNGVGLLLLIPAVLLGKLENRRPSPLAV